MSILMDEINSMAIALLNSSKAANGGLLLKNTQNVAMNGSVKKLVNIL